MNKEMMIDYRDGNGIIRRMTIDDMEFCVRDGYAHFLSSELKYHVPLASVIQVYFV